MTCVDDTFNSVQLSLWISCVELYNEKFYDLLSPQNNQNQTGSSLTLKSDRNQAKYLVGLKHIRILNLSVSMAHFYWFLYSFSLHFFFVFFIFDHHCD